jgi:hypothetical protein
MPDRGRKSPHPQFQPFLGHELQVPLLHDTVAAFLKRAEALAEIQSEALVEVAVTGARGWGSARSSTRPRNITSPKGQRSWWRRR